MSWLDFAYHFLSNQKLCAWSWINRTFSGMVFFWWEIWLWVFGPFPFFLFTWWQFCIVQILSGPKTFLHISSIFFQSLIGNFLSFVCFLSFFDCEFSFFLSSDSLIRNLLFFVFFRGQDWHSHPGSRFMVSWDFGSKLVERLGMTYVRVWPAVWG